MSYYRQNNRKKSESTEQERVISWALFNEYRCQELKMLFHVPNGGSRNKAEAANLKRQGVKSGVPDLCLTVAKNGYHGLFIEMKYGKNKTTKEQKEWLKNLSESGYKTAVCYSADEAIREIARYLDIHQYAQIGPEVPKWEE